MSTLKQVWTTHIESTKNVIDVVTDQNLADPIREVTVFLDGRGYGLEPVAAQALADAIKDHLGGLRGY